MRRRPPATAARHSVRDPRRWSARLPRLRGCGPNGPRRPAQMPCTSVPVSLFPKASARCSGACLGPREPPSEMVAGWRGVPRPTANGPSVKPGRVRRALLPGPDITDDSRRPADGSVSHQVDAVSAAASGPDPACPQLPRHPATINLPVTVRVRVRHVSKRQLLSTTVLFTPVSD